MARQKPEWKLTAYGRWLKITLLERDMQARHLAESIGTSKYVLCKWMYGQYPYEKFGPRIEKALGVKFPADVAN